MKKLFYILLVLPILSLAQSTEQNYVKSTVYKVPTVDGINITGGGTVTPEKKVVNVTYFDGLGRPIQQVAHGQSATGKDIVTPITYDPFGRQTRDYLPVPVSTSNMLFTSNATIMGDPTGYYTANYGADGAYRYSERGFEASPLGRILEQGAPGASWIVNPTSDTDHTIKFDHQANTAGEVKLFKATATWNATLQVYDITLVNPAGTTFYPEKTLYKTITKDENWTGQVNIKLNTTEEFRNKQGRVVLKRTYNFVNNALQTCNTYYVYDPFGNLTYIIPPLVTGNVTTVLGELCYQYKYDSRNRLVEKKLPGKQWEFILYDKLDRVVATGPANPPFSNQTSMGWLVTKYDALNRPVLTGWLASGTINATGRKTLQATITGLTVLNESKAASNTTINSIPFRYTTVAWPTSGYHVLTVNYYDNYDYTGAPTTFSVELDGLEQVYYNNSTQKPKGLATGSWVRVLTASTSTAGETSYSLYDRKSRAVRNYTKNYLNGFSYADTKLDFSGKVLYATTYHRYLSGSPEIQVREDFTYSDQDRLLTRTHKITYAGNPPLPVELLNKNEYYELGQLKNKRVGGPALTPTGLQKVDYTYNIRGWLKGINDVTNLTQAGDPADLFGFKLNYNTVEAPNGTGTALFNGNISETYWKTYPENVLRKYSYEYDNLNCLTDAVYQKPGLTNPITNAYNESIGYDLNGNITSLSRNGYLDNDGGEIYEIDRLGYAYQPNSNKLSSVSDYSNSLDGFKDGNQQHPDDYGYDANGNLTQDWNKNISSIGYNHLNLPVKITYLLTGENKIEYIYNALGAKVHKAVVTTTQAEGTRVTTTEYLGGFQYRDSALDFFQTAEGYVSVTNGDKFDYVYNYTDHGGNVRLSYSKPTGGTLATLEENHYYPFGMKHINYGEDRNEYVFNPDSSPMYAILEQVHRNKYQVKFNSREFQDELGLNMTAMDYRQYDNAIGRFNSVDVLSEMQFSITPYHFGYNNPVYWADPSGLIGQGTAWYDTMWNSSPGGRNTHWYNNGIGGMTTDDIGGGMGGNVGFATGAFTAFESLEGVTITRYKHRRRDESFIGQLTSHVYSNGSFYKQFRADARKKQWDDLQEGLDWLGVIDPTGLVDLTNAGIYAARGQKANAAIAMMGIIPYVGDLGKVGKYSSKIAEYEKLADGFGTRAFIKEFNNTTTINTKILFNDITQGGTKKIINTKDGSKIIHSTMQDGSIIQLRNFSTKSGELNHSTIEFIGTQNKWKFNY